MTMAAARSRLANPSPSHAPPVLALSAGAFHRGGGIGVAVANADTIVLVENSGALSAPSTATGSAGTYTLNAQNATPGSFDWGNIVFAFDLYSGQPGQPDVSLLSASSLALPVEIDVDVPVDPGSATPEPATGLLFGSATGLLALARRRRA